jgi:hypothetical protein
MMGKASGGSNSSYGIGQNLSGTNTLNVRITNSSDVSTYKGVSWTPSVSTWYHVVVVHDNTAGTADFYINGAQQGSQQTGLATGGIWGSSVFFGIGNWGDVDKFFPGSIDEAGVWSRKLSNGEISQLYNSGNGLAYPFQNNYTKTLTETMTLIESTPKSISRAVTETVTLTDPTVTAANIKVKTLTESMTLTDPPVATSRTGPTSWTAATLPTSIWTQQFPTP